MSIVFQVTIHLGFACSNAMKKRESSTYDLWKSPNNFLSALCFSTKAFLYDISYSNFSIMVALITAIDKVKCALIIALICLATKFESNY